MPIRRSSQKINVPDMLSSAQKLMKLGFKVLLLQPAEHGVMRSGKAPITLHGVKDATNDLANLGWLAGWRPPPKSRHPTSRPRLRKAESTSGACSATKFLSADLRHRSEARAVVAKLSGPEHAELKDWQILARVPSPARGVRGIPLRCD